MVSIFHRLRSLSISDIANQEKSFKVIYLVGLIFYKVSLITLYFRPKDLC